MESSVYKRQIAFGGAASVAFLAAGVLAAGTAYASTNITNSPAVSTARQAATALPLSGAASPNAVVSSLPSVNGMRGLVMNDVVPAAHGIAPAAHGVVNQVTTGSSAQTKAVSIPMQPASGPLAPLSAAVPGMGVASGLLGNVSGVTSHVGGTSNSLNTPTAGLAQLHGVSVGGTSVGQTAGGLTNGLPTSGTSSPLSGATGSLTPVTSRLPGVNHLVGGSALNGNLPINGSPLG
jgi:hypothetical protein